MIEKGKEIKEAVRKHYARRARERKSSGTTPRMESVKAATTSRVVEFYGSTELSDVPQNAVESFMGCGNPIAMAEMKPGDVVLDLGSGAGLDALLAAKRVGGKGRVIGLDMTEEMVAQARENAREMGMTNAEFRLGEIEHIPLPDSSVDVIISNCVINLSPDKDAVFRESYRVLRPGGRLHVSDIVLLKELDAKIKNDIVNWARCISGALPEGEYLGKIEAAGFEKVAVVDSREVTPRNSPEEVQKAISGKLASVRVRGIKPA